MMIKTPLKLTAAPIIKFNTYRFADYKEKGIDLLMRVTTVSVRTVAIVDSMGKGTR